MSAYQRAPLQGSPSYCLLTPLMTPKGSKRKPVKIVVLCRLMWL